MAKRRSGLPIDGVGKGVDKVLAAVKTIEDEMEDALQAAGITGGMYDCNDGPAGMRITLMSRQLAPSGDGESRELQLSASTISYVLRDGFGDDEVIAQRGDAVARFAEALHCGGLDELQAKERRDAALDRATEGVESFDDLVNQYGSTAGGVVNRLLHTLPCFGRAAPPAAVLAADIPAKAAWLLEHGFTIDDLALLCYHE